MTVAVSTISTLTEYAHDVKDVCLLSLAGTIGGIPETAEVTASAPSYDCCPSLYVHISALREAPTSPLGPPEATAMRTKFGNVILVTYVITVIRCAANPSGVNNLPTSAAIEAVAAEVLEDGWALWNGLRHALEDGTIFDGCLGVHFDGGAPVQEQGGCVGWIFTIRASIPGIPHP